MYFNGAEPCDGEEEAIVDSEHPVNLEFIAGDNGCILKTNLYHFLPDMENQVISTELLGLAFEPEQKFEQPDGSPIVFDQDYFGAHRKVSPLSGPFAEETDTFQV